jgi:hypothetical protein
MGRTQAYRFARILVLVVSASLPLRAVAFAESVNTTLRALLGAYRCEVVGRLERIYARGNPLVPIDRFLAISVPSHPHGYVQCMFYDRRKKMLCEAASGFYFDTPDAPRRLRLQSAEVAALARLGYSTDDSRGNFRIEFDVGEPPDFNAIADFILTTLHDGYGARADHRLKFNAPFAPRPTTSCIPVS